MEKSKCSSWNKVLTIWSNHLIALGQMPVLGHLFWARSPHFQLGHSGSLRSEELGSEGCRRSILIIRGSQYQLFLPSYSPNTGWLQKIGNPGRIMLWTGSGLQDIFRTTLYQLQSKSSSLAFTVAEKNLCFVAFYLLGINVNKTTWNAAMPIRFFIPSDPNMAAKETYNLTVRSSSSW